VASTLQGQRLGTKDVEYPNEFTFGAVAYLAARQFKMGTLVGR
jgi:hypothetical protein